MKTMIWKEFRENFKWALLALLVLTIAEFYGLSSSRTNANEYNELTLCSTAFLLVTTYGCCAIGTALGVVQILPELRRDQWAALLHRPVTRSVIFFGKVFSGLVLYGLATVPPLLISSAYVASPGQFAAPFVPGLMFPGFTDLFLGVDFYFAAILLCLHRGRWLGSRGLIALSLPPLFVLHPTVAWPFMLSIPAALIYLAGGWGAMMSPELLKYRPWIGRVSFVMIALTGAQALWLIFIFALLCLPSKDATLTFGYSSFTITQDGQVFTSTQTGDGTQVLTDANGKVVTDEKYVRNNSGQNFLELLPFSYIEPKGSMVQEYLRENPRNPRNYVVPVQLDYASKEAWYQLVAQRYYIGYDKLSRRCVGICDVEGFKPPGAVPKPFPLDIQTFDLWSGTPHHFWSGPQLYSIDYSERSLAPVFNAQNDTIFGALNLIDFANRDKPSRFAVSLENEMRIFDAQAKPLQTIPYSHDPFIWPDIWLATNPALGRIYLQYSPSYLELSPSSKLPKPPIFLDEIDNQGNVVHEYVHPDTNLTITPPGWISQLNTYASPFLPALLGTAYFDVTDAPQIDSYSAFGMLAYPQPALRLTVSDLVVLFILGIVLAFVVLAQARSVGLARKSARAWAIFVFLFGLPGYLTFRLASDWPVRVACPVCGQKRDVEKATCASCLQSWPAREANKTEIFDPVMANGA